MGFLRDVHARKSFWVNSNEDHPPAKTSLGLGEEIFGDRRSLPLPFAQHRAGRGDVFGNARALSSGER
jgi:hypothetical protein